MSTKIALDYLAETLNDERVTHHYTLLHLSRRIGISQSALCRAEWGRSAPSLNTYLLICDYFKVNHDFFYVNPWKVNDN